MKNDKVNLLVKILILVIVILVAIIAYAFVIKPGITGYVMEGRNEGIAMAVSSIMEQAKACQPVPLTFGDTTMNVIWIDCLQAQQE